MPRLLGDNNRGEHRDKDAMTSLPPPVSSNGTAKPNGHRNYREYAPILRAAGIRNTIPIPQGHKSPPPKGFTGAEGQPVSDEQHDEWCEEHGDDGLAFVLADGQQAVDIDNYAKRDRPAGAALHGIAKIEQRTRCEYPETACLYHRDDGSAKYLYQGTPGISCRGELAPGVEVLQHTHRYVHVGTNPETGKAEQWGWGRPGGGITPVDNPIPPEEWAVLPEALEAEHAEDDCGRLRCLATDTQAHQWLDSMPDGPMSYYVKRELQLALDDLSARNGSRHEQTRDHVRALVQFGAAGLPGATTALTVIEHELAEQRQDEPDRASDTGEFTRMRVWAAKRIDPDLFNTLRILDRNEGRIPNLPQPSGTSGETPAGNEPVPTWAPVDMHAERLHRGDGLPAFGLRVDGEGLFYAGKVHSLHGETESGKSWIAQYAAAQCLLSADDTAALYVDFEDNAADVGNRLVCLGVPQDVVDDPARFVYVHPSYPLTVEAERTAFDTLLSRRFDFAVIDGVTEAMALSGFSTDRNTEVAAWQLEQPRAIASRTGAAVVCIDHVTKDADTRGRHAIGSQHKLAGLDGAAFVVEIEHPFGEGKAGVSTVRIAKDRPGKLRGRLGIDYRSKDQTHLVAKFHHDATDPEHIKASLEVPTGADASAKRGKAKAVNSRPTRAMEAVSRYWETTTNPRNRTQNVTVSAVRGANEGLGRQAVRDAINVLVTDEYAVREATGYSSTKQYREANDPKSDRFRPTIHLVSQAEDTATANDSGAEEC